MAQLMERLGPTMKTPGLCWLKSDERVSALMAAVILGQMDSIKCLISTHGHDVDEGIGQLKLTAAMVAADLGRDDCLSLLASLGADCDKACSNGETPAYCAASNGHEECHKVLCIVATDLGKPDKCGATPAFAAAAGGHAGCLALLSKTGACNLGRADNNGATPAFCAASGGNDDCLLILKDAGCDLEQGDSSGTTPAY